MCPRLEKNIEVNEMPKLPTTKKLSIKDAVISELSLVITSFDRAVMTHWRLLLIGVPVMTFLTTSLGYLTAPELCRQSFECVELHVVHSTRPLFAWITELNDLPDEGKLPVLVAIACIYLYVIVAFVYASQSLVASVRMRDEQKDAG